MADVSIATASIVMSGNRARKISIATCERVRAAAVRLGYEARPAHTIRALGLLLDVDGDRHTGLSVIEAARDAASSLGMPPVLVADVERHGGPGVALKWLRDRGVDSLLYFSGKLRTLNTLRGAPRRSALVNCLLGPSMHAMDSWAIVVPDHRSQAECLAQRLIRQGHTRLALVAAGAARSAAGEWLAGMLTEASTWTPMPRVEMVDVVASVDLIRSVAALLDRPVPQRPTAVVALDQQSASAVVGAAERIGLTIPQDLDVVVIASRVDEDRPIATFGSDRSLEAELVDAAVGALSNRRPTPPTYPTGPRVIRVRTGATLTRPTQTSSFE